MNATTHFPQRLHWTALQLAEAVPPRLSTLFAIDAITGAPCTAAANTALHRRAGDIAASRLPDSALPGRVFFR